MGLFDFLKVQEKAVPSVESIGEETRNGIQKAYIPKFLYKPPFGYPRYVDLVTIRRLAAMPFVEMCISTIIDEMCQIEWDIVPKEDKTEEQVSEHKKQILNFFENPNTNKESFEEVRRKYLRDILEIDAGVINKIFNMKGEMVELVARDGATFTKNPDIYGMFTDREDLIVDSMILPPNKEMSAMAVEPGYISAADAREKAAYFQYGWISGARPVPFGKKEIIWFERNPRTDDIYGRSPVQVLAETIQTLIYSIEHNLEYFNDNSIPKGIIGLDGSDAEEVKAFKEQWEAQQYEKDSAGNWKKKYHKVPIVGKIPKFERIQFSNAELELLEGQKWWAKLVWACFGVTSVELGYTEDSKGLANQVVQSNVFKKRCLYPLLRLEEYRINQEIISEFEFEDVEFKFLLYDIEEELKKAQLYQTQLSAGYKSINEIRKEEGLDEVEWGEKESETERFERENAMLGLGTMEDQENDEKKKINDSKEKLQPSQKAELKYKYIKRTGSPGNYSYWYKDPKTGKLIRGFKPKKEKEQKKSAEEKAQTTASPLVLGENETMDDSKLRKAIVYTLKQNEKKIKELIEKEMGKNNLHEIKSIESLSKSIKNILNFTGIKTVSDLVIKSAFSKGWENAEKQLNRNFLVNNEAIQFIQEYTFNNIKSMTEEIMTDLRQELERGIMNGEGTDKLKSRVSKVFDVGENRAEMIARTETNRSENQGKLQAFKSSGEEFKKKWITHEDDRTSPICKRLDGQVVNLNENFKDKQSGWEGPCPPSHVNCRSTVIYFEDDRKEKRLIL